MKFSRKMPIALAGAVLWGSVAFIAQSKATQRSAELPNSIAEAAITEIHGTNSLVLPPAASPPATAAVSHATDAPKSPYAQTGKKISKKNRANSIPARLEIPAIRLNAAIEPVGYAGGNMDVPATDVGWFRYGARPGENGSAVLAGHVEASGGKAGVFQNLSHVAIGDTITVWDAAGISLAFVVVRSKVVPYDIKDTSAIFGASAHPMLNLITCTGAWLPQAGTFDKRLIVFAEMENGMAPTIK